MAAPLEHGRAADEPAWQALRPAHGTPANPRRPAPACHTPWPCTPVLVLHAPAVRGQTFFVLPSRAARHAGPWSILLWAALAAVSYPLARIMAELGASYPSAGGVVAFISRG